ncbi:unnamed protein product [Miscanthus lutarioriparius]|uniref:Uncharacterized protein n=1 Tax=Miscanthus lutarioriparius TaxID=422564 RepID=A0A811R788_9POAL|nr:unnamed protein product [Miscanthus lutarioriparius]
MDSRLKFPLTHSLLLLLCYAAAVVPGSAAPEYRRSRAPVTYYPQPNDFPNEQLYHAYVVIQRFKNTITCDPRHITSSWIGHNICGKTTYVGFECATLPGHGNNNLTVTSVSFDGFGLCAPRLEGFIDQLPNLALFQASANNFGGDIPSLAGLDYLLKIQIIDKYAQADFSVGTPQRPDFLYLCLKDLLCRLENTLHKEVLPEYTNAKALLLNNNFQSGSLPANLGFSKLSYLALANNNFSGTIPPSIQHLQGSLLEILLLNNQLSGCLPHELGMLTNAAVIDAGMNHLTGPIPSSFSCLSSVEQLNLAGNRLYGEVPDALCKLAAGPAGRLANLSLSGNYFTSIGPACAAMIKDGVLDVTKNCIPGLDNQRRPVECAAFLSQPKTMCRASSTQVTCPAAASQNAAARGNRMARDYYSYVTYATLHG